MAKIEISGFDEVDRMLHNLAEIPAGVKTQALTAMAEVGEGAVRATGLVMGVRDPDSSVHILDHIAHSKIKLTENGGKTSVTFRGSRRRGNTTTRNAEIAFVNEYGRRGQPARPFIRQTAEQYGDAIADAGEKIIGTWFENGGGNSPGKD